MSKKLIRWIKIFVLLYCIIGIALYYLQNVFLFHPEPLARDYKYRFDKPFQEVEIPMNKTDTISLVKFFPKSGKAKGVVIYFHGNRANINRYAKFTDIFTRNQFEVWMGDYPGFGKSTGERTEKLMYEQAVQIYRMATSKFDADSILIYGKSLGTGVAAYLASVEDCNQLILETPYPSIPSIFGSYVPIFPLARMITYKLPTAEFLKDVTAPVTIFHGTSDGVIPYRCAKQLVPVLKQADRFITIEDGSHHNLVKYPVYKQTIDAILQSF